jgi:hypothetical protein
MQITEKIDGFLSNKLNENKYWRQAKNSYWTIILKPYVGKKLGNWEFDYNSMSGYFSFFKSGKAGQMDLEVACTPYWEDMDGIVVNVTTEYGEMLADKLIKLAEPTGDSKKDATVYFSHMKGILAKVDAGDKSGNYKL